MKANGFFQKLNFLIALGGVFAALTFYGCGNLFSSADDAPSNFTQPREGYGIVSGNLPSSDSASARTAMPSGGNTPSSYKVFAQSGSQKIEANVNNADRTFSIALPFGTWKITANGLLPNGRIIFTQTKEVTLDASASTIFLQFKLGYSTNPEDGDGEISLSISFPPKKDATSLIRGIEYILSKGEEKIIQNVSDADLRAGRFEIKHTTDNLGAWHLTIQFYGDFSNLVYRIDQTVNVYANLTTDKFEGSAPYISDGNIDLTGDLLADFQNTTLYVNATSGKDTNTGTQFDPLQTFNRALELVNNSTRDDSTEFRIFLQTDVADGAMLELKIGKKLTVASVGADGTARTITSLGRTFIVPDTSELTVQSVAFISLRFEVSGTFTMNDGSISKNTADTNGGGVYVDGGTFTMNDGEIHDNNAKNGGGVYVTGGAEFTMSGGEIIGNETNSNGGGVYVTGNASTFTITGGTINGNKAGASGGAVYVYSGKFIMSDTATISGNKAIGSHGGGICCVTNNATFEMNNGTISGNTANKNGGSVYVTSGARFTMSNGTVSGNKASGDGGGVYVTDNASTFTMTGGTIGDENTAQNGGGVYVANSGMFTMSGTAAISGNKASKGDDQYTGQGGGVYVYSATLEINGTAKITGNNAYTSGGGIYIYKNADATATLTMRGGEISKNTAAGNGGGVYNQNGVFTMISGTIGDKNTAQNGGGVYVSGDMSTSGSFTMEGGKIIGNEATDSSKGSGGGVYLYNGIFIMEGGEISDNTAKGVDGESFGGGGIYLYRATTSTPGGKFTLKGGIVSENNAKFGGGIWAGNLSDFAMDGGTFNGNKSTDKGNGNGAYVNPCTFKMSGAAKFAEDNDVYLCDFNKSLFATITVAGALTAESPVATITPSGVYAEGRQVLSAGAGEPIDSTDCAKFALTPESDDAEWKIAPDGTGYGVLKKKIDIYVRGENATWYEFNEPDALANKTNSGDRKHPLDTIQGAIAKVREQNDGTDAYTIYVDGTLYGTDGMADFSALDKNLTLTIKALSETTKATLDASGGSRRVINANTGTAGALNLTLENLVIMGGNISDDSGGGIQFVSTGGTLKMKGCEVHDNKADSGGGIFTSGALKMENCTITDNTATRNGGGICVEGSAATLTMTSGTIESNEAVNGGGVYVDLSTFTMNGTAKISGNKASGDGGGVALIGGDDTFTMNGGEISRNTAAYGAGIHVSVGGKFTMTAGTISDNTADGGTDRNGNNNSGGGGIYVSGNASTFNMTGGTIESNTANVDGGGVALKGGMFTLESGTISGNGAAYGAGIHVSDKGKFTMTGGTVSGNTADGGKDKDSLENNSGGGGIHLYEGTVEMSGGEISGNYAKGTADDSGGGGIYIYPRTTNTFTMTGTAKIIGNDAGGHGGGVYKGAGSNFTSNITENISDNTPDDVYNEP